MLTLRIIVGLLWVVFWIYWVAIAFTSKRSARRIPPYFIRLRILLVVILIFALRFKGGNGLHNTVPRNWTLAIVGTVLFAAGLSLAIWARVNLSTNWGMPMTEKAEPELVTSGPYRYIRHPIYSGILLAVLGTTFVISYVWIVFLIFSGLYFIFSAFQEEKYLKKQFGRKYTDYMQHSKMLIPFVF